MVLCPQISVNFFVFLSLIHSSFCSHWHMEQVLVTALKLCCSAWRPAGSFVIVTGGTHRALAPVVPEGNVPQEKMGCIRKCSVWQPLYQRKLALYMSLKAGADFFTWCTQEAAWPMSDFPIGSLPWASQKGKGVMVKYYSLTFYMLTDWTGVK